MKKNNYSVQCSGRKITFFTKFKPFFAYFYSYNLCLERHMLICPKNLNIFEFFVDELAQKTVLPLSLAAIDYSKGLKLFYKYCMLQIKYYLTKPTSAFQISQFRSVALQRLVGTRFFQRNRKSVDL